jgi:hypothetical protein
MISMYFAIFDLLDTGVASRPSHSQVERGSRGSTRQPDVGHLHPDEGSSPSVWSAGCSARRTLLPLMERAYGAGATLAVFALSGLILLSPVAAAGDLSRTRAGASPAG